MGSVNRQMFSRIFFIVFLVAAWSCEEEKIEIYNEGNYWTAEEALALGELVNYMDDHLMNNYDVANINLAYQTYSIKLIDGLKSGSGSMDKFTGPGFDIDKLVFRDKIWAKMPLVDENRVQVDTFYDYAPNSAYLDYLEAVPDTTGHTKKYAELLRRIGDITPSWFVEYADVSRTRDFSDPNQRLIFAVHFITLSNAKY